MKDPNIKSKLLKAIVDRWGYEVAIDPQDNWNRTKEGLYLEQLREIEKRRQHVSDDQKVEINGVLIPLKLINKDKKNNRICDVCNMYSLKYDDDLYINKYQVCKKCYIEHIEDREDKWKEKSLKNS